MKPEARPWAERAEQDLAVSRVLLDEGYLRAALFHAHEAIEMLKAIWVERWNQQAEKTHSLRYLIHQLEMDLSPEQSLFLRKLDWELVPSRYPEGDEEPDEEAVRWYHDEARELFQWLRQHLT